MNWMLQASLLLLTCMVVPSAAAVPGTLPSVEYTIPMAGAELVSAKTTVVVRYNDAASLVQSAAADWFIVEGNISGVCPGTVRVADDDRTVIFVPEEFFQRGEQVDVQVLRPGAEPYRFTFTVSLRGFVRDQVSVIVLPDPCSPVPLKSAEASDGPDSLMNGVAIPSDFPYVRVDVNTAPGDGLIFLNNWGGSPYLMILDNLGTPRYYKKMSYPARDFKVQPTGLLTYLVPQLSTFYGMDSTYTVVDTFRCKHGYGTDEHELQMLPNGHVLMIALDWQIMDMSQIVTGGKPNATVVGNHIQELDTRGDVVFEWRSWDHFTFADAIGVELRADIIDYVHMNAVDVDEDGNVLVSSRHLSEVTKINRRTGGIIWRLGGKNNQFTFLNDTYQISYQHDVRCLPGEHYTIFDNGNFRIPQFSRAVEFLVDSVAKTVERVWQYRHSPDLYTPWMGNVQRLAGGNTFIGWGDASLPKIMEVQPDGTIVYQADFVSKAHCYRTFRFPWKGQANAPYLVVERHNDRLTLLYNLFGERPVNRYYVYAGTSPHPTTRIDSSTVPRIDLRALGNDQMYYIRVTAADSTGWESGFSNEEKVLVRYVLPGESMVFNGDFSQGMTGWELVKQSGASALGVVTTDGRYFVAIGNPGAETWSVQLRQIPFDLTLGKRYIVAFDASASDARYMDVRLEKSTDPYTNYSRRGLLQLTRPTKRFTFSFQMIDPSDGSAQLVFNMGQSDKDVTIDNVEVREAVTADAGQDPTVPSAFTVHEPFPNPFNPSTTLRFELPEPADVRLTVVNLLGERVVDLDLGRTAAGLHDLPFSPGAVASGVYIGRVEAASAATGEVRQATIKLLYLK